MARFFNSTALPLSVLCLAVGFVPVEGAASETKKCLFVSSYHHGYEHSDAIERGLRSVLEGKCEVLQFEMDAKRMKSVAQQKERALIAKAIIDVWKPDIVITADDEAAKHLVKPFFKDHKLPFVFCGLNWTAKEYGFPYSNVTGMIEVAPIVPTLERAQQIVPSLRRAFYVGANILSEEKNLKRFRSAAAQLGFELDYVLAKTTDKWIEGYERGQSYDLVIIGSSEGVVDWDAHRVQKAVLRSTRKLSVTNHGWMMPFTILGVTKVSEEQGEWAAKAALNILSGVSPSDIPIVPNSQRDIWVNSDILQAAGMRLPEGLLNKAKKVSALGQK